MCINKGLRGLDKNHDTMRSTNKCPSSIPQAYRSDVYSDSLFSPCV